ncbi:hypothetical protein [Hymenobacter cellulosilyticus]|uniref:Uncharacterized protein n=1 Tax=Hymenobacter cellulosilyticus TaxID=2932248 RepID=A0A8T9QC43_9BACT|nr:hypothetical protein [Hymenobacter cellulosilyticus]UOQ73921.1 hypothetical protein MUN79_08495 [Hymenobacter cellulosilyticus]
MKTSLLSLAAAFALLASTNSFAAAPTAGPDWKNDRREDDRRNDRNDKDFNYGYDRSHRVTPAERARWEAAYRRNDNNRSNNISSADRARLERERFEAQRRQEEERRRNDRNDGDFNYGYDRSHRVTAAERARWEAQHRNDNRYDGRR